VPHVPQFVLSFCVFVQKVPASVAQEVSVPHELTQLPPLQINPVPQALPQLPQLLGSEAVSTHEPPHDVFGALQKPVHMPALQTWPG
jgi:hypothetical protein